MFCWAGVRWRAQWTWQPWPCMPPAPFTPSFMIPFTPTRYMQSGDQMFHSHFLLILGVFFLNKSKLTMRCQCESKNSCNNNNIFFAVFFFNWNFLIHLVVHDQVCHTEKRSNVLFYVTNKRHIIDSVIVPWMRYMFTQKKIYDLLIAYFMSDKYLFYGDFEIFVSINNSATIRLQMGLTWAECHGIISQIYKIHDH